MKLPNIKLFSQKDSCRANIELGTSSVVIFRTDGCLICDAATMLCYHGKDTTPEALNDALRRIGGYFQACRLIYSKITELYPDITFDWKIWEEGECSNVPAPLDLIDRILASGRVPIIKIVTSKILEHWACVVGKDEAGSFIIADPIDGSEQYFQARYGDPEKNIYRIICYSGPVKEVVTTEILNEQVVSLHKQLSDAHKAMAGLQKTLGEQTATIDGYEKEAEALRKENGALVLTNERQGIKIEKLEKGNKTLEEQNKTLRERLKSSQKEIISNMSIWTFIRLKLERGR